jgi:hypothetical protein
VFLDRSLGQSTHLYQTDLLRLSRTNFSETFQLLVHLKVLRLFVESVLRYGLPAHYAGVVIKVIGHLLGKRKLLIFYVNLARLTSLEENSPVSDRSLFVPGSAQQCDEDQVAKERRD